MGSSNGMFARPVLRHLAGFGAFGKGFYARRNCENAGVAGFMAQTPLAMGCGGEMRSVIGWLFGSRLLSCLKHIGANTMRKFHSIAALCGDGLRPELQALFERLAIDPNSEVFVRSDGMVQSGPDPDSETTTAVPAAPRRVA
jgi:hypothetical protein